MNPTTTLAAFILICLPFFIAMTAGFQEIFRTNIFNYVENRTTKSNKRTPFQAKNCSAFKAAILALFFAIIAKLGSFISSLKFAGFATLVILIVALTKIGFNREVLNNTGPFLDELLKYTTCASIFIGALMCVSKLIANSLKKKIETLTK